MRIFLVLLTIAVFAWADAYDDGAKAINRGDYQEAVKQFTQVIKQNPNNANAYINRGYSHAKLGDYKKAIEDFTRTIELDPNNGSAYQNRGDSYYALGDYKKATQDAKKACDLGGCRLLQDMTKNRQICD